MDEREARLSVLQRAQYSHPTAGMKAKLKGAPGHPPCSPVKLTSEGADVKLTVTADGGSQFVTSIDDPHEGSCPPLGPAVAQPSQGPSGDHINDHTAISEGANGAKTKRSPSLGPSPSSTPMPPDKRVSMTLWEEV